MGLDFANLAGGNRHDCQPCAWLLLPLELSGSSQVVSLHACTDQNSTEGGPSAVLQNFFSGQFFLLWYPFSELWTSDSQPCLLDSRSSPDSTCIPCFLYHGLETLRALSNPKDHCICLLSLIVWCPMPWKLLFQIFYLVISGSGVVSLLLVCQKGKVSIHMTEMIEAPWDNPLGTGGDHCTRGRGRHKPHLHRAVDSQVADCCHNIIWALDYQISHLFLEELDFLEHSLILKHGVGQTEHVCRLILAYQPPMLPSVY